MSQSKGEPIIIVDLIDSKELFKFSSYDEVNEFTTTLKKGTIIKLYIPDKIHTMRVT